MAKKPSRTWGFVGGMSPFLLIVAVGSMAVSFPTLTDVAALAGLPFPFAYPFIVDGGMLVGAVGAANKRLRGLPVRRTYLGFAVLAVVSVVANAVHSTVEADPIVPIWAAAVLGAVPPATLLWATHEVMDLVPDEKERAKLVSLREKSDARAVPRPVDADALQNARAPEQSASAVDLATPRVAALAAEPRGAEVRSPLKLVSQPASADKSEVRRQVLEFLGKEGTRPTGKLVGEWLGGKTPKTGQRFLAAMEEDGAFASDETRDKLSTGS